MQHTISRTLKLAAISLAITAMYLLLLWVVFKVTRFALGIMFVGIVFPYLVLKILFHLESRRTP